MSAKRKLKDDGTTGQTTIDLGISIETIIDATTFLFVQDDLHQLAAVFTGTDAFADNLDGEDEVVEDGFVDGGKGTRTWSFLLERRTGPIGSSRAREDAS